MVTEQEQKMRDAMCKPVKAKKKIVYTYHREGCAEGEREGDPHMVYETVNGHTFVDIYKTGGVQTKPGRELPCWQTYYLYDIVLVDTKKDCFNTADGYNPQGARYSRATISCKIDK